MEEKREEKRDIVFIKSLNEISKAKKVDALLDEVQKSLKVLSEMSKTVNGKVKALSATETQEVVPVKETVEPTEEVKEEIAAAPVTEEVPEKKKRTKKAKKTEETVEEPAKGAAETDNKAEEEAKAAAAAAEEAKRLEEEKAAELKRKQEEEERLAKERAQAEAEANLSPEEKAKLAAERKKADIAARQAELMRRRGMTPEQIQQMQSAQKSGFRREYVPSEEKQYTPRGQRPSGDKPFKQRDGQQRPLQNKDGARPTLGKPGINKGSAPKVEVAFVPKENKSYGNKKKNSDKNYEDKKSINKKSLIKTQVSIDDFDEDKSGYRKLRVKKQKKDEGKTQTVKIEKAVITKEIIPIKELSEKLGITAIDITKRLFKEGIMKTINDSVDYDTAGFIAADLNIELELKLAKSAEDVLNEEFDSESDDEANLIKRPPVITVMGHVDHGKTSLLDRIRSTNVTAGEAGGITQHIGAYSVLVNGNPVTFLDTPGHEAFTSMRMRGAQITDVAVLVVAADDGVMPQTIEAINHAKAAGVSIVVAANKIDKPTANLDRVRQELSEHDILVEEWGGDVALCPVSAKTGEGIDALLETILLVAEMKELKANPNRKAKGTIIEAKLDKGKGPVATVLVQNGTLRQGDNIIAGTVTGRVRAMIDDKGRTVKEAGPSMAVSILGLESVPNAGDNIFAVDQDKLTKLVAEERKNKEREELIKQSQKVSLDDLFSKISEGDLKTLNIIIKADVQGSAEAVKQSLAKLSNEEVQVSVLHSGVGAISETDVMLADSANAIIIGFNVRPDAKAKALAEKQKVDIKLYRIIYEAIEDIQNAMKGMLAPKFQDVYMGKAEVRETFKITGVGMVAGCYVTDGKIVRNGKLRIYRDDVMICEGNVLQLKRFKDDVKEVAANYECGISIENFNDIKVGDFIESYIVEEKDK